MTAPTIAIIGGGFCGTLAAIRLLTGTSGNTLPLGSRVVPIEPGRAGEGLAYRAGPECWRLNVPAARMSAFTERPEDFLEWAQAREPLVEAGDFLPRSWYGDYLAERLDLARRRSPRWLRFDRVRTRAVGIATAPDGAVIDLVDGSQLRASRVLLALGNAVPSPLPGTHPGDVEDDPWNLRWLERLPHYVPRVKLVGTGLTMIDLALAITEHRPDTRLIAVSRHGLLPRPFAPPCVATKPARFDARRALSRKSLSQSLRLVRAHAAELAAEGRGDWRDVVQSIRDVLPALWQETAPSVRGRFLRHLRAFWDVHRHRSPNNTLARIETLQERKRLEILAGRIVETRRLKDGIVVATRLRGSAEVREDLVDAVVNATGPASDPRRSGDSLVRSLVVEGLCHPDPLGLGWATDADGRLLDASGRPSEVLFYAGPLLRAGAFEATAVPELRGHVDRTAARLAASLASGGARSVVRRLAAPAFRRARPLF